MEVRRPRAASVTPDELGDGAVFRPDHGRLGDPGRGPQGMPRRAASRRHSHNQQVSGELHAAGPTDCALCTIGRHASAAQRVLLSWPRGAASRGLRSGAKAGPLLQQKRRQFEMASLFWTIDLTNGAFGSTVRLTQDKESAP
jgi:hypothetical protein